MYSDQWKTKYKTELGWHGTIPQCLVNCANSHCLKEWDFNNLYVVMLYWFQLNTLKSKSQLMHKQSWVKNPSINTQMGRHETVSRRSEHYSPRVKGSITVRNNFLLILICCNTILAELIKLRKTSIVPLHVVHTSMLLTSSWGGGAHASKFKCYKVTTPHTVLVNSSVWEPPHNE